MKRLLCLLPCFVAASLSAADLVLVQNGRPRAEIVTTESPLRTVRLAAQELQNDVEKISGAHLPIVTLPSQGVTHVFVGRSSHTDQLKVTAEGLKDGAYRITSGPDWLALIGLDTEFTPIEPWAKNNGAIVDGSAQREWEKITGAQWGLPNLLMYKDRFTLPGVTGLPDAAREGKRKPMEIWSFDERGSFNAVCGLMQKLGMRWYAPGDTGEVVPVMKSITLAKQDEVVEPDIAMRRFNVRFAVNGTDVALWAMRLGSRDPYGVPSAHGMVTMTDRAEVFEKHPDWFAMMGGKRRFKAGENNHLCYSNEELIQETVRYVRAVFDQFKVDMVSIMPPDGYTAICQCPLCAGKDSPERDSRGLASDYIWGFVNRVAREVRKTHPNGRVHNAAYGIYSLPPLKIDKLEPNVVVSIVGGRRPMSNRAEDQEACRQLRESWAKKTDNPIINFENYPFTDRGWYLPAFTPHSLGESINATKGMSQGEDVWLSMRQDFETKGVGFNHFLVYFTQRMYWGGKGAEVEAMFQEYCRLFYGPAGQEMRAFFEFCEGNWQAMEKEKDKADAALALFAKAQAKVDAASVYGRRMAWMDDFLKGLRNKSQQLGRLRGPAPVLRLVGHAHGKIVVDGELDDEGWTKAFPSETCHLRELETGRQPVFGTHVKAAWQGNDLYFGIRCDEHPGEKPNIGASRNDDAAIWYGDVVELLIETESHSYYQIAISPSGAVADLDRSANKQSWQQWDSKAEVATKIADDHWNVEIRLPVTEDENDPLHQIIGHHPTKSLPWHINICRQRVRDDGRELSAFAPTGADHFHNAMKFATFYNGNSFDFDHGPPDDDFLEALRKAAELARTGHRDQLVDAYVAAASREATPFQKAHALELAVRAADGQRKPELAEQLVERIPVEAVKKAARMQHLLDQSKAPEVLAMFGSEDIGAWPFWKRGDGYFARGRARFLAKAGKEADADLTRALEWLSDARVRDEALACLAENKATNLHDDEGALKAYHQIIDDAGRLGTATQFEAVHAIAGIEAKRGRFDEALAVLGRGDDAKLRGVWRDQFRLWRGELLQTAGRKDEAAALFKTLAEDASAEPRVRKQASAKLGAGE